MKKILISLIVCILFGCKSTQTLSSTAGLNPKLKAKQILKAHNKENADFTTLQSRVKIELIEGDQSQSHTVSLRMEHNKIIWINAFLNMVRLKITPERVQMYNKLDRTYFDGDFSLIKDLLGVELTFSNIENLILGDALFKHKPNALKRQPHPKAYALAPKQQHPLYDLFYRINPSYFKIDVQEVSQPLSNRMLNVFYQEFQEIQQQILPQKISIKLIENQKETTLKMNFKSVSLNQPLRFPFKFPSGFNPIDF